ncbi:MFS transporter [uncultured Paraglaciecola sp.]|uniref:MFS transporter n=1 Tax=uncultured Paraglaciecola sp. TaxID=1765024 RepID=UPI0025CCCC3F|nr:MFS transporter [uncultured Paraglaciecola sp.]
MSRLLVISAIAACYFMFAILLNSVGTVILQSINSFGISKPDASTLEGFKDLSIALVSFLVASFIPRIGYKMAMLFGLLLAAGACLVTPIWGDFVAIKLLFACIGTSFALVKVSVYSLVGQLTHDTRSHSSLLNTIEGIFMLGVLSGYWIFSAYIDPEAPTSLDWLNVYYPLAAVLFITAGIVLFSPIQKAPVEPQNNGLIHEFVDMLKLAYKPLVLVFVLSVFLYVLIEQGIGTWLPTFNSEVLHLPVDVSVQITSIFAAMIAIGRLMAGQILKYMNWFLFLNICIAMMAILMLLSLPLADDIDPTGITGIFNAPIAAYLLPLAGLMMAPIYPIINSVMLSSLEKAKHAQMTGLIVVFSALGGTTGSVITGLVFDTFGGKNAFYLSLLPMALLATTLYFFRNSTNKLASSTMQSGQ